MFYDEETEVYTVDYENLEESLSSLEEREEPYKINITGIPNDALYNENFTVENRRVNSSLLGRKIDILRNKNVYLDLSPTILPDAEFLRGIFSYYEVITDGEGNQELINYPLKIVKAPVFPDCVKDLQRAFEYNTYIKECRISYKEEGSVPNYKIMFRGCVNLEKVTIEKIPENYFLTDLYDMAFYKCDNLKKIVLEDYSDFDNVRTMSDSDLVHLGLSENIFVFEFPYEPNIEIAFKDLDAALRVWEEKYTTSIDNPLKFKVTGLVASDLTEQTFTVTDADLDTTLKLYTSKLNYVFYNHKKTYIDISDTILPAGITSLKSAFSLRNNSSLVLYTKLLKIPEIPNTVTDLSYFVYGTYHTIDKLVIPESVTNISYAFVDSGVNTIWFKKLPSTRAYPFSEWRGKLYFDNVNDVKTVRESATSLGLDSGYADITEIVNWNLPYEEGMTVPISNLEYALQVLGDKNLGHPYEMGGNPSEGYKNLYTYVLRVNEIAPANMKGELTDTPTSTTSLQGIMALVPEKCFYIKNDSDCYTSTVTDMQNCFYGIKSLVGFEGFPDGVTNLDNAFANTSLRKVSKLPVTTQTMEQAFLGTKIETAVIPSSVTNYNKAYSNNNYLKGLYIEKVLDTGVITNGGTSLETTSLESIVVNTEEEKEMLLTTLVDVNYNPSDVVKVLKVKSIKTRSKDGVYSTDVYSNKLALQDTGTTPLEIQGKDTVYYIQTLDEKFRKDCEISGTGISYEAKINDEPIYIARSAGTVENPFLKKYDPEPVLTITNSTQITITKEMLGDKGGVLFLCSGKGANAYGEGGNGYIKKVEIPVSDVQVDIKFEQKSVSNGQTGGNVVLQTYTCEPILSHSGHYKCSRGTSYGYGGEGGNGGYNITCSLLGKQITVYGGGGGGGNRGTVSGYVDCWPYGSYGCELEDRYYRTSYGSYGIGGLTGAGTGIANDSNGLSYNQTDLGGEYPDWTGSATVFLYKYI